jgi:hypothetical protein
MGSAIKIPSKELPKTVKDHKNHQENMRKKHENQSNNMEKNEKNIKIPSKNHQTSSNKMNAQKATKQKS